ncbi:MFS transporter [Nocardioides marmoribigeumensis]|uniref:MFS family permease n=1 Tax=Nocardioides marmoribigeumensis TaxID=433649 RepID=A0ABU2BRC1_9ACTN|nr:MFS transporter [Nocardioides marmoribigeumensis]MDR7361158.1 MFS family permease [Nocardioides marmoribigeumensis]
MLSTYRRVLRVPGAAAFTGAAVVARLPMSMTGLGIVLLVTQASGSYAHAGRVSATYVLATALASIPLARLVDRLGQRRVLLPAAVASGVALLTMVLGVRLEWSSPLVYLAAFVAGGLMPNFGSAVRTRWTHALDGDTDRRRLDTAFAWEAVMDEVVFVVSPTVATVLAATASPSVTVVASVAALLLGATWLHTQRSTEPPASAGDIDLGDLGRLPWRTLGPLSLTGTLLGVAFGGCEVATVALADEQDKPLAAGVILAVWSLGSLLAGLVTGALTLRRSAATRVRLGLLALAVASLPTPFLGDSLALTAFFLLFVGAGIAPTMIASVSWVESLVPRARLNEALAVYTTGVVAGVAPGAALSGAVVDAQGARSSYGVLVVGLFLAVLLGLVTREGPRVRETASMETR